MIGMVCAHYLSPHMFLINTNLQHIISISIKLCTFEVIQVSSRFHPHVLAPYVEYIFLSEFLASVHIHVNVSITVKNNLIKIQEKQQLYASRWNSLVSPLGICSYCLVFTSISYMTSVKWSYLKLKCFTLWLIKYICIVPYLCVEGRAWCKR